jgi:hypothetical protein
VLDAYNLHLVVYFWQPHEYDISAVFMRLLTSTTVESVTVRSNLFKVFLPFSGMCLINMQDYRLQSSDTISPQVLLYPLGNSNDGHYLAFYPTES